MEIRMVKCPNCNTVYNAAVNTTCPGCAGGAQSSGFSKTAPVPSPSAPTGVNSFGGQSSGGFAATVAPGSFGTVQSNSQGGVNCFDVTKAPYSNNGGDKITGTFFPSTKPPQGDDFAKTMPIGETAQKKAGFRVTGWVVAVDGPNKGKDYRLHAGYNYIGKEKGDVIITGDPHISREQDSVIACDTRTGGFYASHVKGVNLLLVNGEPVISGSVKLNACDIITVGETKLVFVPLICDKFMWEDEA